MAIKKNEIVKRSPPRSYPDLHDHLKALDEAGLLVKVDREINKDTEMHPLVRWQFRGGIEEKIEKPFYLPTSLILKEISLICPLLLVSWRQIEQYMQWVWGVQ